MRPKSRNKQKDILFILISSFVVVVAWIGFNLYDIWANSTVSQEIQLELTPIDPQFDPQTIKLLKNRENINPLFSQATPSASVTVEPTQTPAPTPSQQVTLSTPTPIPSTIPSSVPTASISNTQQPPPTVSPFNVQGQ